MQASLVVQLCALFVMLASDKSLVIKLNAEVVLLSHQWLLQRRRDPNSTFIDVSSTTGATSTALTWLGHSLLNRSILCCAIPPLPSPLLGCPLLLSYLLCHLPLPRNPCIWQSDAASTRRATVLGEKARGRPSYHLSLPVLYVHVLTDSFFLSDLAVSLMLCSLFFNCSVSALETN